MQSGCWHPSQSRRKDECATKPTCVVQCWISPCVAHSVALKVERLLPLLQLLVILHDSLGQQWDVVACSFGGMRDSGHMEQRKSAAAQPSELPSEQPAELPAAAGLE